MHRWVTIRITNYKPSDHYPFFVGFVQRPTKLLVAARGEGKGKFRIEVVLRGEVVPYSEYGVEHFPLVSASFSSSKRIQLSFLVEENEAIYMLVIIPSFYKPLL